MARHGPSHFSSHHLVARSLQAAAHGARPSLAMPLHWGLPFQVEELEDIDEDEQQLFVVKVTGEACRNYQDFIALTNEYASRHWACALSGRDGLTYLEAKLSEDRLRPTLQPVCGWRQARSFDSLKFGVSVEFGWSQISMLWPAACSAAALCAMLADAQPARASVPSDRSSQHGALERPRTPGLGRCQRWQGERSSRHNSGRCQQQGEAQHAFHSCVDIAGEVLKPSPCPQLMEGYMTLAVCGMTCDSSPSQAYLCFAACCVLAQSCSFDEDLNVWTALPHLADAHGLEPMSDELMSKLKIEAEAFGGWLSTFLQQ